MKKLILLSIVLIFSCSKDPIQETETQQATFQTKAKPNRSNFFSGGTFSGNIEMNALDYGLTFNNLSQYMQTGLYYSRRETVKDPTDNYSFLEEINSEDYKVQIARGGSGSFFWMDGNVGNANAYLDVSEVGGYSSLHINNKFIILKQDKGIYKLNNLKTFETNEDARAYFSSVGFNHSNLLYKTSDGTLKATY